MKPSTRLRRWRPLGPVVVLAAVPWLAGCPNPNVYGTARTTPKNKVSHTISAEVLGAKVGVDSGAIPMVPSYHLRYGATDRLEIGGHLLNLSTVGFDLKWNFLRSDVLDLAIDPAIQTSWVPSVEDATSDGEDRVVMVYLHGPLLVDLNVTESLSVVLSPGVFWAGGGEGEFSVGDVDATFGSTGLVARAGAGMNFRFSERFAIQPEVTFLKPLGDSALDLVYVAGLGFNFGALPSFGPEPMDTGD